MKEIFDRMRSNKSLGVVERLVFDVVKGGKAQPEDVRAIAQICRLSELHVRVALQLLRYKELIP